MSMKASDHIQMPDRVDNVVELKLSPREEKLYRQIDKRRDKECDMTSAPTSS